jgi:hypothetical protein
VVNPNGRVVGSDVLCTIMCCVSCQGLVGTLVFVVDQYNSANLAVAGVADDAAVVIAIRSTQKRYHIAVAILTPGLWMPLFMLASTNSRQATFGLGACFFIVSGLGSCCTTFTLASTSSQIVRSLQDIVTESISLKVPKEIIDKKLHKIAQLKKLKSICISNGISTVISCAIWGCWPLLLSLSSYFLPVWLAMSTSFAIFAGYIAHPKDGPGQSEKRKSTRSSIKDSKRNSVKRNSVKSNSVKSECGPNVVVPVQSASPAAQS